MIRTIIKQAPKSDLHCHRDGSLRPETVMELAKTNHIPTEAKDLGELELTLIAPANCDSLVTYLKRFDLPIAVLQTKDALKRAAYELMEDAASENVKYIEIRFAPQQHQMMGLTLEEIIGSVVDGIKQGEAAHEVRGNLILSYLRHTDTEGMVKMIEAGKHYLGKGVVAVDLCAAEIKNFAEKFIEPVKYARGLGYRVTIHAGETGISANVLDAITILKADRIGHGVAIMNDPEAFAKVLENGITIEVCATSNVQTKAISDIMNHPIDNFYNKGVLTSINTDNRTVSDTTMTKEYELLESTFNWDEAHFITIYQNSVAASYADEATKVWLLGFVDPTE